MIDFSKYNSVKAPVVPTTQGLNGSKDGEEIVVGLSQPFLAPADPTTPIQVDFASPSAIVLPAVQQLSPNPVLPQLPAIDSRQSLTSDSDTNPSSQSGGGIGGIIGRLLLGGSGDESSLSKETQSEKSSKRRSAGNASASFANDPESAAESFMKAPGTSGGSLGSTIGKLVKAFSGLGI